MTRILDPEVLTESLYKRTFPDSVEVQDDTYHTIALRFPYHLSSGDYDESDRTQVIRKEKGDLTVSA